MTVPFRLKQGPVEENTIWKQKGRLFSLKMSLKISHSERLKLFSFNYKPQIHPVLDPVWIKDWNLKYPKTLSILVYTWDWLWNYQLFDKQHIGTFSSYLWLRLIRLQTFKLRYIYSNTIFSNYLSISTGLRLYLWIQTKLIKFF